MKTRIKKIIGLNLLMILLITYSVPIKADTDNDSTYKPILEIESVNIDELYAGSEAELKIELKNTGFYSARKIEIRLDTHENSPINIISTTNRHFIKTLNPNEGETLTYHLKVDNAAIEDYYALDFTIDYYNTDDVLYQVTENINFHIIENEDEVQFAVTKVAPTEEVSAGEAFDLVLDIMNDSTSIPKDIVISLDGLSTDTLTNTNINEQTIEKMSPTVSQQVTFSLYANATLTEGVYPVSINIDYENEDEEVKNKSYEVFINIIEEQDSDLVIQNINKSHTTVIPEQGFTIEVDIENISSFDAENVEVNIEHEQELVPISQSKFVIQDLPAGSSQTVSFQLEATDNSITQNYPITVYVNYNDGESSLKQYTGINVNNDDDEIIYLPKLMINEYSTGKEQISVGESFDLAFTLLNTSTEKTVKNVKISLNTDGDTPVFMPIGQSNSLYINSLSPEKKANLSIPLKVISSAESKIYALDVAFDYQDDDGNEYSDNETINIQVYQDTEITISDVRIGKILDNSYTIEVDFFNTGKVDISNLMVDIEGVENAQNSNYYVGDFSTGRTDIYDVILNGSIPKPLEGKIIFTYDNTFGEKVVVEKPFNIKNEQSTGANKSIGSELGNGGRSKEAFSRGGKNKENISQTTNSKTTAFIPSTVLWIGIPIVLALLFVIILRKKKRKKGMS